MEDCRIPKVVPMMLALYPMPIEAKDMAAITMIL